jgi:hypothetical protein
VLLRNGWVFESELARTLSEQWKLPYVALAHVGVDAGVTRLLPVEIGLAFAALPVRQTRNGDVHVAFADPSDEGSLEIVGQYIPSFVPAVAELTDIETTWRKIAGSLPSF